MKTILLTGGSGYIARYLLRLAPPDVQISVTVRNPQKWNLNPHVFGMSAYSLNLEKAIKAQLPDKHFDVLIHTAAMAGLGQCEQNPGLARRCNGLATAELAEWCRKHQTRMIYLSTDIVFKGNDPPYMESALPDPLNAYGRSKLLGERAVQELAADYAVIRIALALGRGLYGTHNFMDWFMERWQKGQSIPLFRDEIRTATAVHKLSVALWQIALSREQGLFHLAGRKGLSRLELGRKICARLGRGEELLRSVSLRDRQDYIRPADVSLISTRTVNGQSVKMASILDFVPDIVQQMK